MSQLSDYSIQSELAQAAYGTFLGRAIEIEELTSPSVGMSTSQANAFITKWQVAAQSPYSITGFSATVFEEIGSGKKYLAIRGTELSGNDLTADGLLASAIPPSLNPQFIALRMQLDTWLSDPDVLQGQSFTVTGHSLGGYLAAAVKQSYSQVTDAYLYNAPGVSGPLGNLVDALRSALGLSSASTDNIWNIRGSEGFPVIAGLGYQLGTAISIQTEASGNNHSISVLNDALAIQSLHSQLAPNLSQNQLSKLIDAFGSTKDIAGASNSKTLESALDALRTIVLNPANGQVVLGDGQKTEAGDRDKFYTNLYALQNNTLFKDLAGNVQLTPLSDLSASNIIAKIESNSQQGVAAQFALVALNPFILEGNGVDYSGFNTSGALDRFDPDTGTGALTSAYLVDRMTMLIRKNWFNIEDKNPLDSTVSSNSSNHSYQNINDYFEDVTTGYKVSQGELSDNTPRYFFGGNGADNPAASKVEDHFYGGGGNDILNGGEGDDYLEGGIGNDTYTINPGDGFDALFDADGVGSVKFGTVVAEGKGGVTDGKDLIKIGNGWADEQNGLIYLLSPQADGTQDLLISYVNGSDSARVKIKNWSEGKLGITLGENTPLVVPAYDQTITETVLDRNDVFDGSTGNDLIQGLGGNDFIQGKEGDDRIEGGIGTDSAFGNTGKDIVLGGAGSDLIAGQENDDRLYADGERTIDEAYAVGETQAASGQRGDLLDGGPGSDIATGEAGDDILMGGMGKDVMMGLGGDDTIEGDIDFTSGNPAWNVTRHITTENNSTVYSRSYNFSNTLDTVDANTGDDDVIYSGAGKDWVFTQGGDDFVDAGVDDDVVFGEGGNDLILGQGGDDVLMGDNRNLDAALHGDDHLDGGSGTDTIWGDGGSDHLVGGSGDDELTGDDNSIAAQYQGNDVLEGGIGNDKLYGNGGNDTLNGGTGVDQIYGGAGDDTYQDVEPGDSIGDIEGKNTIMLADTSSLTLSSADEPIGMAISSFAEPSSTVANAPSGATWLANTNVLHITLENGGTLDLQGALYGMDAQIYFDHGAQGIDLESWVSENLHDAVTLNLEWVQASSGEPLTHLYSGTGADLLQGSVNNDTISGYGGNDQLQGGTGDDLIMGGLGSDVLIGQEGGDALQGGEDNDELQGGLGNDTLNGDAGDDNLFGQEGGDVLNGGAGNDVLSGNAGDDVYSFSLGGGQDVIWEEGDTAGDVLRFGEGIVPADISAAKSGYDLVLFHANGVDQVKIANWYADPSWRLLQFEFADGTIWNGNAIANLAATTLRGTAGADTIYGSALNETLMGLDGNDSLYGNGGNDTLIGGKGNDNLNGGTGIDTFLFALGDGVDRINPYNSDTLTLRFAADIFSTDIVVERVGNDLMLRHQNGSDSITVANWYLTTYDRLQQVVFDADGTTWSTATLDQMGINFNNQYTLNLDDGAKTIEDWGGADSLAFGTGIGDADITIARVGQNLKLTHVNGTDSVTIKDWFNDLSKQIETIRFSTTGTVLTTAQLTTPFLTLTGTAGNDVIQGGNAYGETLSGLGGNDTLNGGQGADTYLFNQGDGQDTITDTSSPWYAENSILFGAGLLGQLNLTFESNNDRVYSFGADSVRVKAGSGVSPQFISNGTAAAETLNGSSYRNIIHGLAGNDVINGNVNTDDLYGDAGNDTIAGGEDADWLYGGDGDDVLDGYLLIGSSDDQTYGSDSVDYYMGGRGNDTLNGNSRDDHYYFNLGDGNDTISEGSFFSNAQWFYSSFDDLTFGTGITPESIQVSKLNNDLVVKVSVSDSITIKNWFSDYKSQVDYFLFPDSRSLSATNMSLLANTLHGTSGDDVLNSNSTFGFGSALYGEAGNDTLNGGSGNDILYGGTGNDTLNGSSGNDALHGEAGNDMLNGSIDGDEYFFERNGGQDIVDDTGGSDTARFDASIRASDLSLSRSGNDLILALTGTNDKLTIRNYMSDSYAIIESWVFTDGSNLPSTQSILDSFLNIRGTSANDNLDGTAWADVMYGGDGNDVLNGLGDADKLYGGAGNDVLDGGGGTKHDYLEGGTGNDIYRFTGASFSALDDGGSDDKIELNVNINPTNLSFQRWGGDDLHISIAGGSNIDIYDQFLNDSAKVERLQFADGTTLGLRDIQFGTGSTLTGTSEDSILIGSGSNDTLNGGDGNDWLDGGIGNDTMTGGLGNDLYFVDSTKDTVTELTNQGIDTVSSAIGYTLGANVEHLVLTGTARINGTGNALDNTLIGNNDINTLTGAAGNDWLDGKEGIDKMIGGAGDDTYVPDNASEIITERSNEGTDRILTSISYTLPSNVENLTLTGTAAINGTGNTLNNMLIGNAAANSLFGDTGNDTLDGMEGADMLTGGKGNDTYILGRGYGIETVVENDTTAGNTDMAQFLSGISANQIWFQHTGNNLEVSVIGTADRLVIKDWYLGSAYHVEQFRTANGLTLQDSKVENLVTAMAGFAPPDIGQTTLPPAYQPTLDPVIASLWL
ncbi:Ca2+-binding RTX toxin-like protein [Nitrosomonas sp. Nm84]|uniref:calcium-binding protein n=1 Tax=Nitrosomonas sp. Nm84 TaxID=200124 RepID=UPI000D9E9A6A|nr:calcium-binding protein [Nitrosomonas sp. Nm84]PXW81012.1 Ca2+-binding RTX toxin-like protein [Nitrosomonas sp. Nm84]